MFLLMFESFLQISAMVAMVSHSSSLGCPSIPSTTFHRVLWISPPFHLLPVLGLSYLAVLLTPFLALICGLPTLLALLPDLLCLPLPLPSAFSSFTCAHLHQK